VAVQRVQPQTDRHQTVVVQRVQLQTDRHQTVAVQRVQPHHPVRAHLQHGSTHIRSPAGRWRKDLARYDAQIDVHLGRVK